MMDFDEIVVKESPGLCRCCLSEGCYKDLGSEYSWMSETEIYADMLLECFDISISQHPTGPNGSNRLICEVCITRLRDACNFKKQVLESEKRFVDMVGRGEFRPKVLLYQTQMKTELNMDIEEDTGGDDPEVEYLEDDPDYIDEDLLKNEDYGEPSVSEDITVSALAVKGKRGRPKKSSTAVKPEKKAKVPKLEEKSTKSKAVAKGPENESEPDGSKQKMRLQIEMKRRNIESVLLYSNVIPFIWHRGKHMCFFCQVAYKQPSKLLTHYDEHDCVDLPTAVKRYTQKRGNREAAIKVEITDIYCKLCSENMANLDELIQHLIENHNVDYDLTIPNCFLPFRLKGPPTCGTCNMEFDLFEYLLRHANKQHLKHSFICEICGKSSFSERYHVLHVRNFHKKGGYRCEYCGMKLSSLRKKSLHIQNLHKANQFKCTICDAMLKSSYFKNLHLAEVHGVEEKRIKCPHCPRVFPQDNIMIRHMKRVHLKLKEHKCPVCGIRFFESYQMKNHLMYHFGENNFSCEICGKTFLRKHYLTKHLNSHKISGKIKEESYDSESYQRQLQTAED